MRGRHAGYMRIVDENGTREADTFTCAHCSAIVSVQPGSGKSRGWCRHCGKAVCGKPACMKECVPFMRKIEAHERASEMLRRLGIGH